MTRDLTRGNPSRVIVQFAIPILLGLVLQQVYNLVDTMIVGKFVGLDALGGVGSTGALNFMVLGSCIGLCMGFGIPAANAFGAGEYAQLRRYVANSIYLCAISAAVVMAVVLVFCRGILTAMHTTPETFSYAYDYIYRIFWGIPFVMLYNMTASMIRAVGDSKSPVLFLAVAAGINVVLDLVFILVFHMGVAGAAWATILSQFVSFCLLIAGTFRGGNLKLNLRNFSPSLKYYKNIVKGGTPSLCRQGLGSFATICLNLMAGPYGDAAIAAMSIVTRITQFANSIVIGFGQGFQPVCGFNYGAKLYARVREGFWFCVKLATCILLAAAVLGWLLSENLIAIFLHNDPLVIEYGSMALRLQCITFPLVGWITISNMMLQTIGRTVKASLLAMSRQFLFFVPAVLLLPNFLGMLGVQLSQPIADVFSFLLAVPLALSELRDMKRLEEQLRIAPQADEM